MRIRSLAFLSIALVLGRPVLARAQGAPAGTLAGLANVSASAGIGPYPGGTAWSAAAGYVPFVNDHLQLGGGLSYAGSNGSSGRQLLTGSATARYLFGDDPRSAPFLEADLAATGGQKRVGSVTGSAAVGWLRFLTSRTALDARFVATRYSLGPQTVTQVRIDPSVFVRGLHEASPADPQAPRAFDYAGAASITFQPNVIYAATADYAPFFIRILQVGVGASYSDIPPHSGLTLSTDNFSANAMVRAYYPAYGVLRPFVEALGSEQSTHSGAHSELRTHGGSVGTRYYLSPELGLDLKVMHRIFDPVRSTFPYTGRHEETVFNAALVLHHPG